MNDAILDGEIVCLGPDGWALFNRLLYRRAEPYFYAFDCLWLNGRICAACRWSNGSAFCG